MSIDAINTAAEATATVAAEAIGNASEVIIEANEAVIHVTAKSGILTRVVNSTGGRYAAAAVAVAAVAGASYYGWKKFKARREADAKNPDTVTDVKSK